MRPRLAADNTPDLCLGNAKHVRDGLLRVIAAGIKSSRFADHIVGEFPAASPFANHVGVIVAMTPGKQMVGVAASGLVALVTDNAALQKFYSGKNQRHSAGRNLARVHSEYAIPVLPFGPCKRPTRIRAAAPVNLRPKSVSVREGAEATSLMAGQKPCRRSLNSAYCGSIAFPDECLASTPALAIPFCYVSHVAHSTTLNARGDN